ncbi:histidinol-phosphate transaminase [Nibricoccus aquaticus]|uniref:Histidinol-phosphate aminotransferase n=1 Tax=Nibricoccus aquaticus TaxID=2576891 RepID=A0A290QBK2_9BACT|nr:histidinol-phosphate transaminase [Nibricoccus aquaticus]ATC66049.1 histidinol-phosphate transaminase [Nibricoccus aquaticus]
MPSPSSLALPHVAQLHAYTPGLQPTESGWVKLNTNECPYAPSPRVAEAIRREVGEDGNSLRLYPNPKASPLRAAVAKLHGHGLTEAHVCIGNGSDDILNLLVRAFCDANSGAGYTLPSYSLYPVLVAIQDGRVQTIDFDRTMQLPLAQIAESKARAFFLTSPNAPTGVAFTRDEIEAALKVFKGLFVVDEAYALFAKQDAVPLLAKYPNLVITRTLSKAYALAGIRVGYALAHPEVIDVLDRVRDSYNVNRLSQAAALAAVGDMDYYHGIITKVKETRDFYIHEWQELGWFTYRSQANFIFTEPKNAKGESGPAVAKSAYDFLYKNKVLVRYFPSHPLTASFLRISVGTDEEMLTLDEKLQAWLQHA